MPTAVPTDIFDLLDTATIFIDVLTPISRFQLSTLLVPVYVILMIILAAMINHLIGTDEMWSRWQSASKYPELQNQKHSIV